MSIVSNGNSKLGQIPNTSFPPVITCRKGVPCASDGCYALKFYRMYPSCKKSWDENLELYKTNPDAYWDELRKCFRTTKAFRYFVSGDIPDRDYFIEMIRMAKLFPGTDFLCFTKQFEIVNSVLEEGAEGYGVPGNLHLVFSTWEGFTPYNPYNLPESAVITDGMEVPDDWKICGGNCFDCICRGVGCWELKNGETIAFHKH